MDEITIAFVGAGGDGAVAAGDIIATACARQGLHVMKTEAYGPQIRGGESSCTVRIGNRRLYAPSDSIDLLVVFSWSDFARFQNELVLAADAVILHDESDAPPPEFAARTAIAVPFNRASKEENAPKAKNVLSLGAVSAITGLPADAIRAAVTQRFGKKAEAVIEASLRAFDRGLAEMQPHAAETSKHLDYEVGPGNLLISGNDASSLATIDSGCRFFAGYPITPSTEVLMFLAEWLPKMGGTVLQTEDELSAIGAVIGASFAGQKAVTSTSGPGLSLMSEMLGLAAIAEIPAVVINVQRGGPSTGLPTKSEQSDLFHAVFGGHGDTPRVVIAPSDVEDSYHATVDAFNIAEEYQTPVIVLTDQSIAQRRETIAADSLVHEVRERRAPNAAELETYRRYALTADGVSPMASPGLAGGVYQTNGLEHDEQGRPSSAFVMHEKMNEKRYRKLRSAGAGIKGYHRLGTRGAQLGIICWGSTLGSVREAVSRLGVDAARAAIFAPRLLTPFPADAMQQFIDECEILLVAELSYAAQFHQYLRTQVDLPRHKTNVFSRSGGKSFGAAELLTEMRRLLVFDSILTPAASRLPEEVLA
jgi:2-oxoglutarate/2-oxoacid ferredoxin oxidoreductase subunit alpha